ncbi:hypothetical protein Tco_0366290 [Tanacetum coccineum]
MTGNIAYLSDFKEFDEGYVTFGGGAHGGRIFVTAAELLNIVRHHLVLPVQVNAVEDDFINTSIQAKAKTVNGKRQLQALVDKKKVIITETSIRSDLHLEDAGGTDCLPTAIIFEELARMGYEKPSQRLTFYKAFFSLQWKFLIHTITQCLSAKTTAWNEFSSTMASTIICLATNQKFNLSKYIFDSMVLDLEKAKDAQAKEIVGLKKRVQKLERKKKSRTTGLKRLRKVGKSRRVKSSEDKDSLGAQEDASKQERSFEEIDKDAKVSLVDETQWRSDDAEMFDTYDLHGDEVIMDMAVALRLNVMTTTSAPATTIDEINLAQTLIQIKADKPKVVTTVATTTTTTRPKARGVVVQEPSEFRTNNILKLTLKKKYKVALDEEMARNLEAQLQAELIEEERIARKKEEEANIALIESWENTQAMMEADRLWLRDSKQESKRI